MARTFHTAVCAVALVVLAGCSRSDDSSSPEASPTPSAEKGTEAVARCLTEQGWDVQYDELENSIAWSGTSMEQSEAYDAAYAECSEQFGEEVIGYDEFTDAMWQDLYSQETETAECLREQGIDVPQVPSFETFVQTYPTEEAWTSYQFVPSSSESSWRELNRLCPQPRI